MLLWVRVDDFRALIFSSLQVYIFAKGQTLTLIRRLTKKDDPLMYKLICKGLLDPRFPIVRQTVNSLKVHHTS